MKVMILAIFAVALSTSYSFRYSFPSSPYHLKVHTRCNVYNANPPSYMILFAKSKMPQFNEEEAAELERILSGEDSEFGFDDSFGGEYDDNLPDDDPYAYTSEEQTQAMPQKRPSPVAKKTAQTPHQRRSRPDPTSKNMALASPGTPPKPVMNANSDWRSAYSGSNPNETRRKPQKAPTVSASDFTDLDYDDFEAAMMEEDNAGLGINMGGGMMGSKVSAAPPVVHNGLYSGDTVRVDLWGVLKDSEGQEYSAQKFTVPLTMGEDIAVVFADPRRMNDEFKTVLIQFSMVPKTSLKIKLLAVNCDDSNDQRKFVKKNALLAGACKLLCDPSKKFMDTVKCRAPGRLSSSLLIIDTKTGKIIKVWYENDWDTITTKDMIADEIKAYRTNPVSYMQSQIGIR